MVLISACNSPQQLAQQHHYDQAIDGLLKKNNYSPKAITQLNKYYHQANIADSAAIVALLHSGEPDIWHEIYARYKRLDARQLKLGTLPQAVRQQINVTSYDYSAPLFQTRQKACLYYYTLAGHHLKTNKSTDALQCLEMVNSIDSLYRNTSRLIDSLQRCAPTPVYYEVVLDYPYPLPPGMAEFISESDLAPYNTRSVFFVNHKPDPYRLYAEIRITDVKIAPEKSGELAYSESVEIQDGLAYKIDARGDFVRDSARQKIEIPKYKTLACYVSEYQQEKSLQLFGEVLLVSVPDGKILMSKPVKGVSHFTHRYARFKGDLDALSPEAASLIGSRKQEFPSDGAMIQHATENLFKEAAIRLSAVLDNVEPQ
ncbi:MAG: hypothetical protein EOM83_04100 [Clostridia bacterium]|nr:hypothetical protein [Clostridia bacterium]